LAKRAGGILNEENKLGDGKPKKIHSFENYEYLLHEHIHT
jgi:hypothetical protein